MQPYREDSPEAMARLLTALMAIDERIDDAEIEALSALDAYARIGITPPQFANVLRAYFSHPQVAAPEAKGTVNLFAVIDHAQYTPLIDAIVDPVLRARLWDILVGLARADDEINAREAALLRLVALRWWQGDVPTRLQRAELLVDVSKPGSGSPLQTASA
jgi:uncharacterized tellurite resistance protein B-like protein